MSNPAEHVTDAAYFELPKALGGKYYLPDFGTVELFGVEVKLQLTKFMVLEAAAAVLLLLIFIPLARRIATGKPPRGYFWNFFEAIILFIRNEVVRPSIGHSHSDGHHDDNPYRDADRFLPFILTLFFFILGCNLMGLLPWCGSPTGALGVTAAMAVMAFLCVIGAGMAKFGAVKFWLGLCPHMDVPLVLKVFLVPMMLAIEIVGLFIKHIVLAVRLLSNMFAGHLVVAVVLGFIVLYANSLVWYGVMPISVLGATALNMLELFVAFLQAYLFAFLTALFIGMASHQH